LPPKEKNERGLTDLKQKQGFEEREDIRKKNISLGIKKQK
jgi:hypothetical protein